MTHSVYIETAAVFGSLLFGLAAGLLFEIFRFLRTLIRSSAAAVAVEDVLFWLIFGAGAACFFVKICNGRLMLFPVASVLLGFFIFYFSFGRLFTRLRSRTVPPVRRRISSVFGKKRAVKKPCTVIPAGFFVKKRLFGNFFSKTSSKTHKKDVK